MSVSDTLRSVPPITLAALVLGLAFIGGVGVASYTAYSIKASADVVEVTGSAKMPVQADFARWTINLEAKTGLLNQQQGYDRLETATAQILAYLKEQGLTDVEAPAATLSTNYLYPQYGEAILTGYSVYRTITVRSSDVEKLTELTNEIDVLTGEGYTVTTGGLELTYQKLQETRVALLTEAIADAKDRAEAIAKETGRSVGTLRSATGGVVQVLPLGGIDVSDYGAYDTTSKDKEVMVTVRATFSLR
jgi:uncharacterized protein